MTRLPPEPNASSGHGREPRLPERECGCGKQFTPSAADHHLCGACYSEKWKAWREGRERRERREDALHRRLLRARPKVITDIYNLPSVADWRRRDVSDALDGLVTDGRLSESADGRLIVRKRPA